MVGSATSLRVPGCHFQGPGCQDPLFHGPRIPGLRVPGSWVSGSQGLRSQVSGPDFRLCRMVSI